VVENKIVYYLVFLKGVSIMEAKSGIIDAILDLLGGGDDDDCKCACECQGQSGSGGGEG